MFRSIQARLTASHIAITTATLLLIGGIALPAVDYTMAKHEREHLEIDGKSLARQIAPLTEPGVRLDRISELASSFSFIADARVKVMDVDGHLLIDTGAAARNSGAVWALLLSDRPSSLGVPDTGDLRRTAVADTSGREVSDNIWHITKVPALLGNHVYLQSDENSANGLPAEEGGPTAEDATKRPSRLLSGRFVSHPVRVPIVNGLGVLNGSVELSFERRPYGAVLATSLKIIFVVSILAWASASLLGYFVSVHLSRPIRRLKTFVRNIENKDFSKGTGISRADEIGELAERFDMMSRRLETSFHALDHEQKSLRAFIADASHELRTPLSALSNFIELLKQEKGEKRDERDYFLELCEIQVNRITWVTRNLLDISRIHAKLVEVDMSVCRLEEVVGEAVAIQRANAKRKGQTLSTVLPSTGHTVWCDRGQIVTALSNLLDNAIKYTEKDNIIEIGAAQENGGVRFWVKDSGCGIAADEQKKVFTRFYRGRAKDCDGNGLGLAIVENIVELHGGSLSLESKIDVGSVFSITLPDRRT